MESRHADSDRRQLPGYRGALAAGGAAADFAARVREHASTSSRFVFIILRGALDGLTAVPPYGDPDYARLRRELAIGAPGAANGALQLDNIFGLHPSLRFMSESLSRRASSRCFTPSPARIASARISMGRMCWRTAHARPHAVQTGWLNRALAAAAGAERGGPQGSWVLRSGRTCRS